MEYQIDVFTDTGQDRKLNQDSGCVFVIETKKDRVLIAILCDGMGGVMRGELASRLVITRFSQWVEKNREAIANRMSMERIQQEWGRLLRCVAKEIKEQTKRTRETMGTTFAGMIVKGTKCLMCHVGDSRIYRVSQSDKGAERLTRDHSLVEEERRLGILSEEEARKDTRRNILLQCIGRGMFFPEFKVITVGQGDTMWLCTDGFYHQMRQEDWGTTGVLEEYGSMIRERGETDNLSVIRIQLCREQTEEIA